MAEIRIDPLSGEKVIVAGERAGRPGGGPAAEPAPALDPAADPFAEGAEDRTPPEVYAVRPGGGPADGPGWIVRVVPNLFPVLAPEAPGPAPDAQPDLFGGRGALGGHAVVVNAPQSVAALAEVGAGQGAAACAAGG